MKDLDKPVDNKNLEDGLLKMSAKDYEGAEACFQKGLQEAQAAGDKTLEALFCSTLGMLCRTVKDFRQASKYYDKAEKLLPEEPSLKIISSRLILDVFGQYDTAIKRCQKALELAKDNPNFRHHARTTMGMAYLKSGQKEKALDCFKETFEKDLNELANAGQMDLLFLEQLVKKKLGLKEVGAYLEKGLEMAESQEEEGLSQLFKKLHEAFREGFS